MWNQTEVQQVVVRPDGGLVVQECLVVRKDVVREGEDSEIARGPSKTRQILPGDDVSKESLIVQAIAKAVHTKDFVVYHQTLRELPDLGAKVDAAKRAEVSPEALAIELKPLKEKEAERDSAEKAMAAAFVTPEVSDE